MPVSSEQKQASTPAAAAAHTSRSSSLPGPELSISPGSAEWGEFAACLGRGNLQATVDEQLLREYFAQGDGFLGEESIVVDVGGFAGKAMQNLLDRYHPNIFIFEPVHEYVILLKERFSASNGKVTVLEYGLGPRDENITFVVDGENSHVVDSSSSGIGNGMHKVRLRTLQPFFELLDERLSARFIDLLHINCEGCEYNVLEYLVRSPWIARVRHLLVQFHSARDSNAVERRCTLRAVLGRTHRLAWDRAFVWERWDLS